MLRIAVAISGSGDCPAKHLVWSNLKIATERLIHTGPKRSRLGVVRECRDAWSDRGILNVRRSDAVATAVWGGIIRAASGRLLVCAKSGVFRDRRRYRLHQTPNGKRGTLYVPVFSHQRPRYLLE